ncbi:flagellar hook-length control protein FliK [Curtobacterium pusillum]|uniref:flagellar hook-length control protein FliK n=1 Tax=Curtobacterium pusillum TaxID=69373 RepID=UPI0037F5EFB1
MSMTIATPGPAPTAAKPAAGAARGSADSFGAALAAAGTPDDTAGNAGAGEIANGGGTGSAPAPRVRSRDGAEAHTADTTDGNEAGAAGSTVLVNPLVATVVPAAVVPIAGAPAAADVATAVDVTTATDAPAAATSTGTSSPAALRTTAPAAAAVTAPAVPATTTTTTDAPAAPEPVAAAPAPTGTIAPSAGTTPTATTSTPTPTPMSTPTPSPTGGTTASATASPATTTAPGTTAPAVATATAATPAPAARADTASPVVTSAVAAPTAPVAEQQGSSAQTGHGSDRSAAGQGDPGLQAVTAPRGGETPFAVPTTTPTAAWAPASGATAANAPAPLAQQLSRPVFTLAQAGPGEHVVTVQVTPDTLGPVTVRAHVTTHGMHVELFAASDAGREAVRQVLPDLRRDASGTGLTTTMDLSSQNHPGDAPGREQRQPAGTLRPDVGDPGLEARLTPRRPGTTRTPTVRTAGLDVLA